MYGTFCVPIFFVIIRLITCEDNCGPPPEVKRAQVSNPSDTDYEFGSTVTYKCDHGYVSRGGLKTSRCIRDSATNELVWTTPEFTCSPRSCADPGSVENARRVGSRFTFPNNVEYVCNEGYKMSGLSRRFCQPSGVWSGSLPSCNIVSCQRPEDPENGRAVYSSLTYNSELTYECSRDFQLSSKASRYCGSDEEWTGTEPICREIECEMPGKPEFGTSTLIGKPKVGSIVVYKCDPGRTIVGSSTSKCLKSGEWTFPVPLCMEPCIIPSVDNGELGKYEERYQTLQRKWMNVFQQVSAGATVNENEEVILKCRANYIAKFSHQLREITITCREGKLSPEPECITTACLGDPPPVENGTPVITTRSNGAAIRYTCDMGFEKGISGAVKCVYGTWTGNTPTCIDTRCDKSSLDYPGLVRSNGFVFNGNSFLPTCLHGFEVIEKNDKKIYCSRGSWIGNLPPCTKARCRPEELARLSGVVVEDYRILNDGDWLQLRCAEGFEFSNKSDSKVYCHEGVWEGNMPPCSPAPCSNTPPVPENGKTKSFDNINHGSYVEYECSPPYEMDRPGKIFCSYGQWSGSLPACKDSRCYLRNLPQKEGVDLTNDSPIDSGQAANLVCIEGYNLRYPEVYCEKGVWRTDNILSPCVGIECKVMRISNGIVMKERRIFEEHSWGKKTKTVHEKAVIGSLERSGTVLYVQCNDPYRLQGKEAQEMISITCRAGEWIQLPVCVLPVCSDNPPELENGIIKSHSASEHGSHVEYECLPLYEMDGTGSVVCNRGQWQWIGTLSTPPTPSTPSTCKDSRCYLSNLPQKEGVNLTNNSPIESSQRPDIICIRGYSLRHSEIYCSKGKWITENLLSPCQKEKVDECVVRQIPNGKILKERIVSERYLRGGTTRESTVREEANIGSIESSGAVLYVKCDHRYRFEGKENTQVQVRIICISGEWSPLPECFLPRCYGNPPRLQHGRIKSTTYTHGSFAEYECYSPYQIDGEGNVTCYNGIWIGSPPTCRDTRCDGNPPRLHHGSIKSIAYDHGSFVKYECYSPYQIDGEGNVTCYNGRWIGSPPTCRDTRCYDHPPGLQNGGIKSVTYDHGSFAEYECYSPYQIDGEGNVTCYNGKWTGSSPTCKDTRCYLHNLHEREGIYLTNTAVSSGDRANIICITGYILKYSNIYCDNGVWRTENSLSPCQDNEKPLETEIPNVQVVTSVPVTILPNLQLSKSNNSLIRNLSTNHSIIISDQQPLSVNNSVEDNLGGGFAMLDNSTGKDDTVVTDAAVNSSCSCIYVVNDKVLLAHDGQKLVKYGDKILSNTIIAFYCNDPGYFRLRGVPSLQCPLDCVWHSSMFPSCVGPKEEDIIIRVDAVPPENMKIGAGGVLFVVPGTRLLLTCRANVRRIQHVDWSNPSTGAFKYPGQSKYVFKMMYDIHKVMPNNTGRYTCYMVHGESHHTVDIQVDDVECPEIESAEGLVISYSPNRKFNGRASFHCNEQYKREGPSFIICMGSGVWSEPPASCRSPTCSIGSLYNFIPEGVVPLINAETDDIVPLGKQLQLGCDGEGSVLKGNNTAICSASGIWRTGNDIQCIKGCSGLLKKNDSELQISPEKEFYSVGESITVSCPEGKHLTTDVERILCFSSGWTPENIPDCQ